MTPPTLEAASADDGPVGLAGFIRSLAAALIDGFDAEAEGLEDSRRAARGARVP